MTEVHRTRWQVWSRSFQTRLISGMLLLVPLVVTLIVLRFILAVLHRLARPLARLVGASGLPESVAIALSVVLLVVLVYLVGLLATNILSKRLIAAFEAVVGRVPLVKSIYSSSRKAVDMLSSAGPANFKSVAMIEFPRHGLKSLCFVMGNLVDDEGKRCCSVFLPTTPNPTSGFLLIVPEQDVVFTTLTVEEGIKMIVSGGILSPERLTAGPRPASDIVSPAPAPE